jgi:hypothetical protein
LIRIIYFALFLAIPVLGKAQDDEAIDHQKNHLLVFQYGYSNSLIGKTFGAKGGVLTAGFNAAKLFSNTLVIGPVCDVKLIPGFGTFRTRDSFLSDFNASFVSPEGQGLDSANAEVMRVNLNSYGKHSFGIKGNTMGYLGLMFSLFPHKAGAVMLQVKRGGGGYVAHQLIFENPGISNISGNDSYAFTITKSWKYELTFKPQAFFEDVYIDVNNSVPGDFWKTFSLSFFYEKVNFKTAEFNGTKFSTFLTNDFMTKYAFDNRFGFKIGFSLY